MTALSAIKSLTAFFYLPSVMSNSVEGKKHSSSQGCSVNWNMWTPLIAFAELLEGSSEFDCTVCMRFMDLWGSLGDLFGSTAGLQGTGVSVTQHQSLYNLSVSCVGVLGTESSAFLLAVGLCQFHPLVSCILFVILKERIRRCEYWDHDVFVLTRKKEKKRKLHLIFIIRI